MPNEVKSAEQATKIAASFLRQYYGFLRPISAKKENARWVVQIDVGIINREIADVEIDASTSEVVGYSVPK